MCNGLFNIDDYNYNYYNNCNEKKIIVNDLFFKSDINIDDIISDNFNFEKVVLEIEKEVEFKKNVICDVGSKKKVEAINKIF